MKVEEAKTKVCPFIQRGFEKELYIVGNILCVCGDCMAWVYTASHDEIETKMSWEKEPKDKVLVLEHGTVGNRYRTYGIERNNGDKEGYCARLNNE